MKKADNFDAGKWLVENKITTQSRLKEDNFVNVGMEEIEKMAFPIISTYNEQNGLDPIQSIKVTSSQNNRIWYKAIQANVTAETNTGKLMDYELTWDNKLNLQKLTPPSQPSQKQKEESKPIFLTPIQKKDFINRMKSFIKDEDFDTAMEEAGNILARVLTNDEAEFIEDVEDFGYNSNEVEDYAQDLVGNLNSKISPIENKLTTQSKLNEDGKSSNPKAQYIIKLYKEMGDQSPEKNIIDNNYIMTLGGMVSMEEIEDIFGMGLMDINKKRLKNWLEDVAPFEKDI
jgi:hypothetical protein